MPESKFEKIQKNFISLLYYFFTFLKKFPITHNTIVMIFEIITLIAIIISLIIWFIIPTITVGWGIAVSHVTLVLYIIYLVIIFISSCKIIFNFKNIEVKPGVLENNYMLTDFFKLIINVTSFIPMILLYSLSLGFLLSFSYHTISKMLNNGINFINNSIYILFVISFISSIIFYLRYTRKKNTTDGILVDCFREITIISLLLIISIKFIFIIKSIIDVPLNIVFKNKCANLDNSYNIIDEDDNICNKPTNMYNNYTRFVDQILNLDDSSALSDGNIGSYVLASIFICLYILLLLLLIIYKYKYKRTDSEIKYLSNFLVNKLSEKTDMQAHGQVVEAHINQIITMTTQTMTTQTVMTARQGGGNNKHHKKNKGKK